MHAGVLRPLARRTTARPGSRLMHRLPPLILTLVVLLAVPSAALASPEQIYDDCQDNGRLDKRYSDADYRAYYERQYGRSLGG